MHIVGLPDKAVAESRERVQAALHASGLSMPAKKVTVNLAPADLPKEGSHFRLKGQETRRLLERRAIKHSLNAHRGDRLMMNLDDFVSETLRQIIAGVAKAQSADNGGNVNAAFAGVASGSLIDGGGYGVFSRVDFDVATTAETSAAGKASVKVWSVGGAEGGGEKRNRLSAA